MVSKVNHFKKDFPGSKRIILCRENKPRISEGVEILPWQTFFKENF